MCIRCIWQNCLKCRLPPLLPPAGLGWTSGHPCLVGLPGDLMQSKHLLVSQFSTLHCHYFLLHIHLHLILICSSNLPASRATWQTRNLQAERTLGHVNKQKAGKTCVDVISPKRVLAFLPRRVTSKSFQVLESHIILGTLAILSGKSLWSQEFKTVMAIPKQTWLQN